MSVENAGAPFGEARAEREGEMGNFGEGFRPRRRM